MNRDEEEGRGGWEGGASGTVGRSWKRAALGPSVNSPSGTAAAALLSERSHSPARPETPSASGTCGKKDLSLPAERPCQVREGQWQASESERLGVGHCAGPERKPSLSLTTCHITTLYISTVTGI